MCRGGGESWGSSLGVGHKEEGVVFGRRRAAFHMEYPVAEGLSQNCWCGRMSPKHNIFGLQTFPSHDQYLSGPQDFFKLLFVSSFAARASAFFGQWKYYRAHTKSDFL